MVNKNFLIGAVIVLYLFILFKPVHAQTTGLIFEPSSGTKLDGTTKVLDPDGNGYISDATGGIGFSTAVSATTPGNDVPEFEIPMHAFPTIGNGEVLRDIRSGPNEGFTDFSVNDDGTASYFYLDDENNFIFRFRLADFRPNAKGYTVLIDTDNKFGNNGDSDDDPNYTPTNPGFEIAIMLRSKHEVSLIDIDGASTCGTVVQTYDLTTYHQKAISGIGPAADGDPDYFYDFYIPFADITSNFTTHNETGGAVTTATPLRMSATTNTSNTCAFEGALSDVGGIDDEAFEGCPECLYEALIEGQVPTDANSNAEYPEERTECPTIEGSYPVGTIHIIGTAVPGAQVRFYLDGIEQGSASVTANAVTGVYISGDFVTTSIGEVITVTATDIVTIPNLSESKQSCAATIVTATPECAGFSPSVIVATPNASGQSDVTTAETTDFTLANALNATLRFFSNGADITGTGTGTGSFQTPTSDGTTITWVFDMYSNEKVPCGTMYAVMEDNDNGLCPSTSPLACNEAGACQASASTIPVISTNPITTLSTTIAGTSDANDNISLYANGIGFATNTADGSGNWSVSSLDLSSYKCFAITATANGANECASAPSAPEIIVEEVSTAPEIINPPYCGTTTSIYGTSYEADGTTPNDGAIIQIYLNGAGTAETQSALVNSFGKWAISGLSLIEGTSIQATASEIDDCQTESPLSTAVAISSPSSNIGITITTDPILETSTSITGNFTGGGSVNVYIDEVLIGAASVGGSSWTISSLTSDDLYEGGKIQATQTTTGCESELSADFKLIDCSSIPAQPSLNGYTPTCADITGTSIDLTATGIQSGYIYILLDNNDNNLGVSQYSNSSDDLILATTALPATPNPALIKVKAEKFNPALNCYVFSTNTLSIQLNAPDVSLNTGALIDTIASGDNTQIYVEPSEVGVSYTLRIGTTVIGSPQTGDGDTIFFSTGALTTDTTFNILAENGPCSTQLSETVRIVISAPVSLSLDPISNVDIDENTAYTSVTPVLNGTPVGSLSYSLGGTDADDFTINPANGQNFSV